VIIGVNIKGDVSEYIEFEGLTSKFIEYLKTLFGPVHLNLGENFIRKGENCFIKDEIYAKRYQ
jgi:hypothetical protein